MTYFVIFLGVCFVGGAVASNPYYGVVGLVLGVVGCGWLLSLGAFISLVLFLVYLGGMLVVFVYVLAADFPEAWGDWRVMGYGMGLLLVFAVGVVVGGFVECWKGVVTVDSGGVLVRLDFGGVAMFYHGVGMFVGGWGLLLTLFVVELVRGLRGAIRAV
ncbi:NADH dehydrogenase subunit 6 (mitochondrion) [Egretta garzetta]|uniref:NADH-ubiquinone oxidoreductase chain 6 n=1 Tax=Egretta garzetta TaxID=188379 RepID=X4Y4T6_EGRGA|nr:NADH dehydrogenase subunit 6 [Egretta garzetta]AHV78267.1 NADH dehydrogenase subunit 6 [Egretta garzetta]